MAQCIKLAKNKIHLFIEKPLSSNLQELMIKKFSKKTNKVLIAYIFNLNQVLILLKL